MSVLIANIAVIFPLNNERFFRLLHEMTLIFSKCGQRNRLRQDKDTRTNQAGLACLISSSDQGSLYDTEYITVICILGITSIFCWPKSSSHLSNEKVICTEGTLDGIGSLKFQFIQKTSSDRIAKF